MEKNEFYWRYLDIHKLLDFLLNKQIVLSRLDTMEDELEALSSTFLFYHALVKKGPQIDPKFNQNIKKEDLEGFIKAEKENLVYMEEELKKLKKKAFISCWFYGSEESYAMWKIYSNMDGFALKIPRETFENNFINISVEGKPVLSGSVNYVKKTPYETKMLHEVFDFKNAIFQKDISYECEKEYRLGFIDTNSSFDKEKIIKCGIPNIKKLNIEIVANPFLEDYKFNNFKEFLKNSKIKDFKLKFSKSEILVKNY